MRVRFQPPTRPRARPPRAWPAASGLVVVSAVLAVTVSVAGHEDPEHGTISVLDDQTADAGGGDAPTVDCDLWVHGSNLDDGGGTLVFYAIGPDGGETEVFADDWTADTHDHETGGFGFVEGPFSLATGDYRVQAFVGPRSDAHSAPSAPFRAECDTPTTLPCPTDLRLRALPAGHVEVSWVPAPGSDATAIHRGEGSGELEEIAVVPTPGDAFRDEGTQAGSSYTYMVTGVFGDQASRDCPRAQVAAVPAFPTAASIALAVGLGATAYVVARRRR